MSEDPIRVLLIDDDEDDRIIARDLLQHVKGTRYALDTASSAAEGRAAIARRAHDVYLVDYHLGEALGVELVKEATAAGVRAPFVMFTGLGDEDVALAALQAGAADYLVKGEMTSSALHRAIRYALERARSAETRRVIEEQREALAARDDLIAAAAHELRNPLNALQLSIQSLARKFGSELSERGRARLSGANAQVSRLVEVVARLLDVSRITTGKLELAHEVVDLAALVRTVVSEHAELAQRFGSVIEIRGDESLTGFWDRARLEQVVANLVSNAIQYGEGAPVTVTLSSDEREAVLVVADRGPGIPESQRDRIFDRFERATTLKNVGGLGVGLWLVREVVKALGGAVSLASETGAGSTFTVRLPREAYTQKRSTVSSNDSSETGFSR